MSVSSLKKIFINRNRAIIVGLVSFILLFNTGLAAAACSTTTVNSAPASSVSASPTFTCASSGVLAWIMCPIITLMENAAYWLDEQINQQMQINSCEYFNPTEAQNPSCANSPSNANSCVTNEGFYTAWSAVRSLALGFLVIGALVMVIAQALGFEAMDAYTVKKVLPRILIAVIGISLSYQLIQFSIQIANDLGVAVQSLIYGSFKGLGGNIAIGGATAGIGGLVLVGAVAFLVVGGLLATLVFVGTAVVAAFAAFFVIVLRQILIIFLAILAPVAIAMYILPGTEKLWKMWRNTYVKALLMFPLIAGIIAVGHVFAEVAAGSNPDTNNTIDSVIALIAYYGPYFIIPSTFKFAGGILATAGSAVTKVQKGINRPLKKYSTTKAKQNYESFKVGQRWKKGNAVTNFGNTIGKRVGVGKKGDFGFGDKGKVAMDETSVPATDALMKTGEWQAAQFKDDAMWALTKNTEAEARTLLTERGVTGSAQDQALITAKRIGFGKTSQVAAIKQLGLSKRGFGSAIEAYDTIDAIAGNNEVLKNSLIENVKYSSKGIGRNDRGAIEARQTDASGQFTESREAWNDRMTMKGFEGLDVAAVGKEHNSSFQNITTSLQRQYNNASSDYLTPGGNTEVNRGRVIQARTQLEEIFKNSVGSTGINARAVTEVIAGKPATAETPEIVGTRAIDQKLQTQLSPQEYDAIFTPVRGGIGEGGLARKQTWPGTPAPATTATSEESSPHPSDGSITTLERTIHNNRSEPTSGPTAPINTPTPEPTTIPDRTTPTPTDRPGTEINPTIPTDTPPPEPPSEPTDGTNN
jgi:hypothetical protein